MCEPKEIFQEGNKKRRQAQEAPCWEGYHLSLFRKLDEHQKLSRNWIPAPGGSQRATKRRRGRPRLVVVVPAMFRTRRPLLATRSKVKEASNYPKISPVAVPGPASSCTYAVHGPPLGCRRALSRSVDILNFRATLGLLVGSLAHTGISIYADNGRGEHAFPGLEGRRSEFSSRNTRSRDHKGNPRQSQRIKRPVNYRLLGKRRTQVGVINSIGKTTETRRYKVWEGTEQPQKVIKKVSGPPA